MPFVREVPHDDLAHDRLVVDDEDGRHRRIVRANGYAGMNSGHVHAGVSCA